MSVQTGNLLIATPELLMDHIFNRSVLLLTEHNKKGSMGFILNKPTGIRLQDVFPDVPLNIQLWNGGPVDSDKLFFIHSVPNLLPHSIPIDTPHKLYIGGDFNQIKKLLLDTRIDERHIKFFLGYSGWAAHQLTQEISEKAWFVSKNDLDVINLNPRDVWKEKIVAINPENIIWKNAPYNPHLN